MSRALQMLVVQDAHRLAAAQANASARLEIHSLLQHVLGVPRAYLLAHPERVLNEAEHARYDALLQRRLLGEPLAYILGEREFFGLNFKVTPATLIPRADTELLVELALQRVPIEAARFEVLDLGTGSGAIALSIAHHRPLSLISACDFSVSALAVAAENAHRLHLQNVRLLHSNWYENVGAQRFHLIVSNPPYIAPNDAHLTQGDLRFEPMSALASSHDGLDDIRHIIRHAAQHLHPEAWLLLEHGYDQAEQVRELLSAEGYNAVFSACDLAGIERVSGGKNC